MLGLFDVDEGLLDAFFDLLDAPCLRASRGISRRGGFKICTSEVSISENYRVAVKSSTMLEGRRKRDLRVDNDKHYVIGSHGSTEGIRVLPLTLVLAPHHERPRQRL